MARLPRSTSAVVLVLLVSLTAAAQQQPPQQRRKVPLREALQLAAKQGPDVAAARAQAEIAQASIRRAWTAWQPDITATGTFDHTDGISKVDLSGFAAFFPPGAPLVTTIVAQNN